MIARYRVRSFFGIMPLLLAQTLSAQMVGNRSNVQKVVEEIDARRLAVETLVARMEIVVRDLQSNRDRAFQGIYLGDKDGNVRLNLKYGDATVLDLAIRGNQFDLWLPRKNRFYRGDVADVEKSKEAELALLAVAGRMQDLFFPRPWTPKATERWVKVENGQDTITVIEKPGIFRNKVRTMTLAPAANMIQNIKVYRSGKSLGEILYGDFRFPSPRAGATQTPPHPGRITLLAAESKRSMQMDLQELIVNSPIPLARFEIERPDDMKIQDLAIALEGKKSLWE